MGRNGATRSRNGPQGAASSRNGPQGAEAGAARGRKESKREPQEAVSFSLLVPEPEVPQNA
jgi:hypothetical protein